MNTNRSTINLKYSAGTYLFGAIMFFLLCVALFSATWYLWGLQLENAGKNEPGDGFVKLGFAGFVLAVLGLASLILSVAAGSASYQRRSIAREMEGDAYEEHGCVYRL